MKHFLFIFFCTFFYVSHGQGSITKTFAGYVQDEKNRPVSNARVQVESGEARAAATTDSKGFFKMSLKTNVSFGASIKVNISATGYDVYSENMNWGEQQPIIKIKGRSKQTSYVPVPVKTKPQPKVVSPRSVKNNIEFTDGNGNLARYSGEVINDVPDGKGKSDGSFLFNGVNIHYDYEGNFVSGKFEGKGTLKLLNSWQMIDCNFSDNFVVGMGTATIPHVMLYEGAFSFGLFSGHGKMTMLMDADLGNCPQGRKYIGEWKFGFKSGYGECYNASGILIYAGQFLEDKPTEKYPNRNL